MFEKNGKNCYNSWPIKHSKFNNIPIFYNFNYFDIFLFGFDNKNGTFDQFYQIFKSDFSNFANVSKRS